MSMNMKLKQKNKKKKPYLQTQLRKSRHEKFEMNTNLPFFFNFAGRIWTTDTNLFDLATIRVQKDFTI